eukprot:INCI20277.1.p1 GENE.INCI20277.1~~INCI20277.1.p1  ORF type:complete len:384 (+),score=57.43 INCI20277.1:50-1201(+)
MSSSDVLGNDLFFPNFGEETDDLGPLQDFDHFAPAPAPMFNDTSLGAWEDDFSAPAPAIDAGFSAPAPAIDSSFSAPAPAIDAAFLTQDMPAPAPVASDWTCPRCTSSMPVFSVSCPCGFSVVANPEAAPVSPVSTKPSHLVTKPARLTQLTKPRAASTPKVLTAKTESQRTLEATEARERELRQQLRQVEQNHAVLREYSNLLRKLLASAQVKVSSATNPFNVVGGRPKRLFRCSKSEPSATSTQRSRCTKLSGCTNSKRVQMPAVRRREEPQAPKPTRPAIIRTFESATTATDQNPAPMSPCSTDSVDMEHGSLAGLPIFDDADCQELGDLVLPSGDEWFTGMPPCKSARIADDAGKDRADSFSSSLLSPFLALASAEASW